MKKFVISIVALYLAFGFIFAMSAYSQDLRTFTCGEITVFTGKFQNPDPKRCERRGAKLNSIATIPFFTVFAIPLLIARAVDYNN